MESLRGLHTQGTGGLNIGLEYKTAEQKKEQRRVKNPDKFPVCQSSVHARSTRRMPSVPTTYILYIQWMLYSLNFNSSWDSDSSEVEQQASNSVRILPSFSSVP